MDRHKLIKDVGQIESTIWAKNNSVAYIAWDKVTEPLFGDNGYAEFWQQVKDEDILKSIKLGREILMRIKE